MAVYRSDQAQLTFATEAAQGGDPELIEGTVSGVSAALTADHSAGVRSITVDGVTGGTLVVGDFIRIGTILLLLKPFMHMKLDALKQWMQLVTIQLILYTWIDLRHFFMPMINK